MTSILIFTSGTYLPNYPNTIPVSLYLIFYHEVLISVRLSLIARVNWALTTLCKPGILFSLSKTVEIIRAESADFHQGSLKPNICLRFTTTFVRKICHPLELSRCPYKLYSKFNINQVGKLWIRKKLSLI